MDEAHHNQASSKMLIYASTCLQYLQSVKIHRSQWYSYVQLKWYMPCATHQPSWSVSFRSPDPLLGIQPWCHDGGSPHRWKLPVFKLKPVEKRDFTPWKLEQIFQDSQINRFMVILLVGFFWGSFLWELAQLPSIFWAQQELDVKTTSWMNGHAAYQWCLWVMTNRLNFQKKTPAHPALTHKRCPKLQLQVHVLVDWPAWYLLDKETSNNIKDTIFPGLAAQVSLK